MSKKTVLICDCGFIAVDMESSRFRRIAKAKGFEVSMVRAYADSCENFQEANQMSKLEES